MFLFLLIVSKNILEIDRKNIKSLPIIVETDADELH